MNASFRQVVLILAITCAALGAEEPTTPPKPTAHTTREIEGWTVHVDDRLLSEPDAELGTRALGLLSNRLFEIRFVAAPEKVAKLQQVPIYLDRSHGQLHTMQYHPSWQWLRDHGYTTNLARCVHIPDAAQFASRRHHLQQPWAVLHELAHSYHDQCLGFEQAQIKEAWKNAVSSGRLASVQHIDGKNKKHYALTDQKEFFAEMSEAYFGMNDFFPFNRAEMRQAEPEIFALMESVWGKLP